MGAHAITKTSSCWDSRTRVYCEDKERVAWKQWGVCIQILTPLKSAHGLAWGGGELVSADSQVHGTYQIHNPQ